MMFSHSFLLFLINLTFKVIVLRVAISRMIRRGPVGVTQKGWEDKDETRRLEPELGCAGLKPEGKRSRQPLA